MVPPPPPRVVHARYRKHTETEPTPHTVAVFDVNPSFGNQAVQWLPFDAEPWLRLQEAQRAIPGNARPAWAAVVDHPGPLMDTPECTRARGAVVTGTEAGILAGDHPYAMRDARADGYTDPVEWLRARKLGQVRPFGGNADTQRGHREEAEAADLFEAISGIELSRTPLGFIAHPNGLIGASPDRVARYVPLLVEIKSKRGAFDFIPPAMYYWQTQTQMFVTGIHNCVLFQYCSLRAFGDFKLPQCCMHLITFNAPQFEIFMRTKVVPFMTRLRGTRPLSSHRATAAAAAAHVMQRPNEPVSTRFAPPGMMTPRGTIPIAAAFADARAAKRKAPPAWLSKVPTDHDVARAALSAAGGVQGVERESMRRGRDDDDDGGDPDIQQAMYESLLDVHPVVKKRRKPAAATGTAPRRRTTSSPAAAAADAAAPVAPRKRKQTPTSSSSQQAAMALLAPRPSPATVPKRPRKQQPAAQGFDAEAFVRAFMKATGRQK